MVVGKTGAAEVPTDPMPPEATDMMIILKPQDEWKSKKSYNELGDEMMERLSVIPGVFFEKNQPIQMRFNELMTGIRQDVAVKIFGENMDTLSVYANKVSEVVQQVKGATPPQVEKVNGLPQINIDYDRTRMANYGLTIQQVNDIVSTAFAGKAAGVIYENERQFELVVRLDSVHRSSIEDVRNLMIPTNTGFQIPISQVADVNYKLDAAQISREAGKRRIVIGFNVAGRDVQSVVTDIQQQLSEKVKLPTGYYFTYGGQFENLKEASNRLMIAVPVSLLLIFALLYFTFRSFKQAGLIFTAIPMSAIGGVFALMLRGMPFSISAGIGFIALFGVAVLNGIVLIGTFNQLKKDGLDDVIKRTIEGTKIRLRPVLMTATVASLGFLPMAISTSAGAEVQKPLATVVIGGLITATFLTLFVLPLLYIIFNSKFNFKNSKGVKTTVIALLLGIGGMTTANAQERVSIDTAINTALQSNGQVNVNKSEIDAAKYNVKTANDIPMTQVFVENEDLRPSDKTGIWKIGLTQSIAWPGLYAARKDYLKAQLKYSELNTEVMNANIRKDVRTAYYQLWFLQDKNLLLKSLDSIYTNLFNTTQVRVRTGDVAKLDQIAADAQLKQLKAYVEQNNKEIVIQQQQLMVLLNRNEWILPIDEPLQKLETNLYDENNVHPVLQLQQQNVSVAAANIKIQKKSNLPEFSARVFSQRLYGVSDPFTGFSVSVGFPLFGAGAYKNKVNVANKEKEVQENLLSYQTQVMATDKKSAIAEMEKNMALLSFFETSGLQQAKDITEAASQSYRSGDISFAELSQFLTQAINIRQNYLDVLNSYNHSAIQYNYLNNK